MAAAVTAAATSVAKVPAEGKRWPQYCEGGEGLMELINQGRVGKGEPRREGRREGRAARRERRRGAPESTSIFVSERSSSIPTPSAPGALPSLHMFLRGGRLVDVLARPGVCGTKYASAAHSCSRFVHLCGRRAHGAGRSDGPALPRDRPAEGTWANHRR